MRQRRLEHLAVAGALGVCLVAGSPPTVVGDGGEYMAQALNFASFNGPALETGQIPRIEEQIGRADPDLESWRIEKATVEGRRGGRDFVHFWFYALLATPAMWMVASLGAPLPIAFAATNLLLIILALGIVLPRIGGAASLLLMAGPIVWWIDKAHTEAFTFALLTIAMALCAERPWWAMVAAGAAATQNPPIAALGALIAGAALVRQPTLVKDWRFLAGAAGGACLAVLHPIYFIARHGTPSLLLSATQTGMPTFAELSAVVLDTNMGLVGNYPLFLIVIAVGLGVIVHREGKALLASDMVVAGFASLIFLYSFARAMNQHSGGTPSLSRYALWLVPLAVPLFQELHRLGGRHWRRFLLASAVSSSLLSVFAFHPSVPEGSREPTWLASFLWQRAPSWDNPLPEVFMDVNLRTERPWVPVMAGACRKILIAGRGNDDGVWPVPCYPTAIPAECRRAGAICYANFDGSDYDFVAGPGRWRGVAPLRREWAWPAAAEPHVRRLYEAWHWRELDFAPESIAPVRETQGARASLIGGPDRFLVVLREIREGAWLRLRAAEPLVGGLIDPLTGQTVRGLWLEPGPDALTVDLPAGFDLLILALRSDRAGAESR